MKLHVGERLEGAGPAQQPGGYVVTGLIRETPWFELYAGKKIFYNFDFSAKRVRETDDVEWLDVYLRTIRYPILDDPAYVQQRRALARAEVRAVLGNRHSNLWPEPIDLLEIENMRDPFAFTDEAGRVGEPVVVYTRPAGKLVADWRQQILPLASILSVLAELLDFVRQSHDEGLLLLGLGPGSLLIDASDRIHYLGTDMVLSQQSALLKESTPAVTWRRLYPAERFPTGYAAPECFEPVKRPDARADLYAWGALAFSLLTGTELGALAQEQSRSSVTFVEGHWSLLEKTLTQLQPHTLHGWAEQLAVDPLKLREDWPRKFLAAFRMILNAERGRRPTSVRELRSWLVDPPPPPVAGFTALHVDADAAKLLIDCTGVDMDLEMTIQCTRNAPAPRASDGDTVVQGPMRPLVGIDRLPVTTEPIFYTIFTRRQQGDRAVNSPGVSAQLWQPSVKNLREWAEQQVTANLDSHAAPPQLAMVLQALDILLVADSLLGSQLPAVRFCALRRLEQVARAQGFSTALQSLLWRILSDPHAEIRKSAAELLWSFYPNKSDALLLRIAETLETPPVDGPIAIVHFLRQLQLSEDRIRHLAQQLEAKRPSECPLCMKTLPIGERGTHLSSVHGYLSFDGDLLPAETVVARLWDRIFERTDRLAHDELVSIYLNLPGVQQNQDTAANRYVADLERFLTGRSRNAATKNGVPVALPYLAFVTYQLNLRHSAYSGALVRHLLSSTQQRVREQACQCILPSIQDHLRANPTSDELRRLLGTVASGVDQTDVQIELCRQLGQNGIELALVQECIAKLQEERLVVCPDCQAQVQARDLELHLRRAHDIHQFRGERKSYFETRARILRCVCTGPVDVPAWKSLRSLAADKHPQDADRYVVAWLYQHIKALGAEQRGTAVGALAEVLVASGAGEQLLPLCVGPSKNATWELLGQRIALETCTRMPEPGPRVLPLMMPLLDHKELPRRARENAALVLLRSVQAHEDRAAELLRAYVAHSSKKRGIEKLHHLEQRFGHLRALDVVLQELDDEIRMTCPRCATELRKKDMVGHLWDDHRLVLDGARAREPWRVIEDWVVDYGLEKDPQVLQRCRELALREDPQAGLPRLQRLLYRRGLRERELLHELRALVRARKSTLCPHCCGMVPLEEVPVIQPLRLDASRLTGYGYVLEVSERGLIPTLRIESPDAILFRGREPGRTVTRPGGVLLVTALVVAITYGMTYALAELDIDMALRSILAVGAGLVSAGLLYAVWPRPRLSRIRLLKAAWRRLVPEIMQGELAAREWSFLHALVKLGDDSGSTRLDQDLLLECCEQASEAARRDVLARLCLAALSKRFISDRRSAGEDAFDFVLTLATECFKGKLPLAFLSDLLESFHGKERAAWPRADLHRLTCLLAHAAFSNEIDIEDWLNLGRAFPIVSAVLSLEQRGHWSQFYSIWSNRQKRPWEKIGPAHTMLDLAQAPREFADVLAHYPDVLLYAAKANLVICSKGVWIEGVCVTAFRADTPFELERDSEGHELSIGPVRIRCTENPRLFLEDIKRWLCYYFLEFAPSIAASARPLAESRHRMWQLDKTTCPECSRALVACPGDLGVALR